MPVMRVSKIGYGMGKKDFDTANCIRVMLGETESEAQQVLELKCNIDDMTAEELVLRWNRFGRMMCWTFTLRQLV